MSFEVPAPASLTVTVPAAELELVSDQLWIAGCDAIGEEAVNDSVVLTAGFSCLADAEQAAARLTYPSRAAEITDDSWMDAWKAFAEPVQVGPLLIEPVWIEPATPGALRIDPGRAFGSGSHPSTRLLLELLPDLVARGSRVLDLGCGSGVLGLAALALGADHVIATDTDPIALAVTAANANHNDLADRVETVVAPMAAWPAVDLIVANIGVVVLRGLLDDLISAAPVVALSGLLTAQAAELGERAAGHPVSFSRICDGWQAVTIGARADAASGPVR